MKEKKKIRIIIYVLSIIFICYLLFFINPIKSNAIGIVNKKELTHVTFYNQFTTVDKVEYHKSMLEGLYIVYDKDTKVEYYLYYGHEYYSGQMIKALSPIYNSNGTIKIYNGK